MIGTECRALRKRMAKQGVTCPSPNEWEACAKLGLALLRGPDAASILRSAVGEMVPTRAAAARNLARHVAAHARALTREERSIVEQIGQHALARPAFDDAVNAVLARFDEADFEDAVDGVVARLRRGR